MCLPRGWSSSKSLRYLELAVREEIWPPKSAAVFQNWDIFDVTYLMELLGPQHGQLMMMANPMWWIHWKNKFKKWQTILCPKTSSKVWSKNEDGLVAKSCTCSEITWTKSTVHSQVQIWHAGQGKYWEEQKLHVKSKTLHTPNLYSSDVISGKASASCSLEAQARRRRWAYRKNNRAWEQHIINKKTR